MASEPKESERDPLNWLADADVDPSLGLSDFAAHCMFGAEIASRASAVRSATERKNAKLASIPEDEPPVNPDDVLPPE
jgi:hypothetical protein